MVISDKMETKLKEEVGYESLYRTFLEFEEYTFKVKDAPIYFNLKPSLVIIGL